MSEATINIPAERVGTMRYHLSIELESFSSDLDWAGGDYEKCRAAVGGVQAVAAAIEQVGWEGEDACELTADRSLLADVVGNALEYAKDDMGRTDRQKLPPLMARIEWLSGTLDAIEPATVGAAA